MVMELPINYDKADFQTRRLARESYVRRQQNLCYYCWGDLDGPPEPSIADKKVTPRFYPKGFFDHPIHLHHDHNTGMTLGAVHAHCNAVLWEYEGE